MAGAIGLTFICFWVIGFPVFIFYTLYKSKDRFNDQDFITKYGLFFVGLEDNAFFWEVIVSNARKVIFIMCSSLLSTTDPKIKAIIGVLVLFIQM